MVHAARASVNRATARFILRSGSAASKGSSTAPPSTRHFLIAGEKILKTELTPSVPTPNAFLIAGVCPTFFPPAPLRAFLIGYTNRLEIDLTHSQQTRKHFLIATICPTFFSPAPLRAILIGTPRRLEIELTRSQQTRKDFLIGTICPTFFSPAPHPAHQSSLITRRWLTSSLFDTNKPHKIIILVSLPMKTKEKRIFYSIQIWLSWHRQFCLCSSVFG